MCAASITCKLESCMHKYWGKELIINILLFNKILLNITRNIVQNDYEASCVKNTYAKAMYPAPALADKSAA